jgi:hypothetical protein
MFSIVIPCFNQGRFLADCLESLAAQTRAPGEVIVVNDGSTDPETNQLIARLGLYSYPFPVRVIVQENRGLPGARNRGILASRGDFILPLDSDDKLLPTALEEYERFFARHPDVDICYPDVLFHGTMRWRYQAPQYNPWRHMQHNWFVPCTAVRRRVFDSGYLFCEEMRRGYEDWEFWLRTCALGPFRPAPLQKRVFAYRKWGYSMLSATNHDEQVAEIRRRHTALGLWSPRTEIELRTRHAPAHLWAFAGPLAPDFRRLDFAAVPPWELEATLRGNHVSRFVWFGDLPVQSMTALPVLVAIAADTLHVPLYAFCQEGSESPYLIVLDRLAVAEAQHVNIFATAPTARTLLIHTRGARHFLPVSIREEAAWPVPAESPLAPFQQLPSRPALPDGFSDDLRLAADAFYYYRREFIASAWPRPPAGTRTLAIVLPNLAAGPEVDLVRCLLDHGALRARFEQVHLFTIDPGDHAAYEEVERWVDGVYPLGAFSLEPQRRASLLQQLLETSAVSDLLLINTVSGFDVIPRLYNARLPVRIAAVFPPTADDECAAVTDGPLRRLASEYANLVDRIATTAATTTAQLVDLLYFPPGKVQTIVPAATAAWAREMIDWLFPSEGPLSNRTATVFGLRGTGDRPLSGERRPAA